MLYATENNSRSVQSVHPITFSSSANLLMSTSGILRLCCRNCASMTLCPKCLGLHGYTQSTSTSQKWHGHPFILQTGVAQEIRITGLPTELIVLTASPPWEWSSHTTIRRLRGPSMTASANLSLLSSAVRGFMSHVSLNRAARYSLWSLDSRLRTHTRVVIHWPSGKAVLEVDFCVLFSSRSFQVGPGR